MKNVDRETGKHSKKIAKDKQKRYSGQKALTVKSKKALNILDKNDIFYSIFQKSPCPIAIISQKNGQIYDVNEYYLQSTGFSRDEVIGHTGANLNLWVDPNLPEQLENLIRENREVHNYETKFRMKNGEIRSSIISEYPITISREPFIIAVIQDITERKQTEEESKKSEEKFFKIFQNSPLPIAISSQDDMRIVDVNPFYERSTGYSRDEIIGHTTVELNMWVDPEMPKKLHQILKTKKEIRNVEAQFRMRNGEIRTGIISSYLISLSDKPYNIAIVEDITERKQAEDTLRKSEEMFRLLIETANIAILISSENNEKLEYLNRKFTELFGYTLEDIPDREHWWPLAYPDINYRKEVAAAWEKRFETAIAHQSEFEPFESIVTCKDGTKKYTECRFSTNGDKNIIFFNDIPERKKTEKALKESEEKYRLLIQNANEAIFVVQDGKLTFANRKSSEMTGYAVDELTFRPFTDFIFPDDRKMVTERYIKRMKGEEVPPIYQFRILDRKGAIIWCQINAVLIDWEGRPATLNFISDVTDRKQAEDDLRSSEQMLRSFMDLSPVGISWSDQKTKKIAYINRKFTELFGYEHKDIPTIQQWFTLAYPELTYQEQIRERGPLWEDAQQEGKTTKPLEAIVHCKDGTLKNVMIARGIVADHVLAVFNDITERKQMEEALRSSEQKLRSLMDASPVGIIWAELATQNIVFINRKFSDLFGYQQSEIPNIQQWLSLAYPEPVYQEQIKARRADLQQAVKAGETIKPLETTVHCKNGTIKYVLVESAVVTDQILSVFTDITERKRMEVELLKTEKMEAIGKLAGGIAHDFNNLLTSLLGNISLAKLSIKSEETVLERLIEAEKATMRAKDLTQQLLTFSRGGAPVKKIASIAEIVKETTIFVLHGSNIQPAFSMPDTIWYADIDSGQISQVIHNLVINAKEAMPNGGKVLIEAENITITIDSTIPLPQGNYIKISIEDQGIGIPEENLQKIFDPYFSTKQTGSGLGLATSYSIIKNHDGLITVESELGAGSTFTIYLPATEKEIGQKPSQKLKPSAKKLKILVMDDEGTILDLAKSMLQYLGHEEIEFARNGEDAIRLYKKAKESNNPFDIAILDLTIQGGMGGRETIQELIKIDPGVKAIVSSGYANDPILSNYQKYGFKGVVPKPYTIEELSQTLDEVMRNQDIA